MDIGLCMTVKDEENRIRRCLGDIADLFAEIVVIDTGSTDRTCEILRDQYGVEPLHGELEETQCWSLKDQRNRGFALLDTPWILTLDADETIARDQLSRIVEGWPNESGTSGFFCPWNTWTAEGEMIEDYKLSLFRKGFEKRGLVHDNLQPSFRDAHASAQWSDAFTIEHRPEPAKNGAKNKRYRLRLNRAIAQDPHWIRYHWFYGYLLQREEEPQLAMELLARAAEARCRRFPVESLNAAMVLSALQAQAGETRRATETLRSALAFHDEVAGDFEVKVNRRLRPWLEGALDLVGAGHLDRVSPYPFAY